MGAAEALSIYQYEPAIVKSGEPLAISVIVRAVKVSPPGGASKRGRLRSPNLSRVFPRRGGYERLRCKLYFDTITKGQINIVKQRWRRKHFHLKRDRAGCQTAFDGLTALIA